MESFSKLEKVWKNNTVGYFYAAHLWSTADTLLANSSPSDYVFTELVYSKYTELLSVVKDGKQCHPSLWRFVIGKLV